MKRLMRSFVGVLVPSFMLAGTVAQPAMTQEKAKEVKQEAKAVKGKRTSKALFENDRSTF